ncbi:hypothetical protein IWQ57_003305 [Coemansia nantahalensis]|uniref:Uncharacterized protein n=1 Tax=Coemansia nantahalensis TaxID=2789366 RepID=A0ACC1JXA3_9FUNG|nr:hypothetical protein IWQ57_003305 [Coemansia nantahalensis]
MLPPSHAYIFKSVLARRGGMARQQLVRLLPSGDHMLLCNTSFMTAIVNSIVYLMNLRPQFCEETLGRLTDWFAAINSSEQSLTPLQLAIVGKTVRLSLLQLYTRRYMGAYSELLETTLDQIGGPEWATWQEQQARERERRARQQAREREHAARQQKQQKSEEAAKAAAAAAAAGPEDEHHSARWVPAPEEGEADMADQPAPGAGGAGAGAAAPALDALPGAAAAAPNRMAPSMQRQRAGAGFGAKRAARQAADGGDEDEEKQSRMLEENAKRVKLDEAMDTDEPDGAAAAAAAAAGPTEAQQRALDADREMEAEMKAAVQAVPQFALPAMEPLTDTARHAQVVEAIKRVIVGSAQLQKFIAHKRVVDGAPAAAAAVPRTLASGVATNSGVLEDSMVMLVRLVTNCYVVFGEFSKVRRSAPDSSASERWKTMHDCVEVVLQMIVAAPRERYGLAMILLYELWMAVVITDPELARAPAAPAGEYTVLALYLGWCERIFDAIPPTNEDELLASKRAMALELRQKARQLIDDSLVAHAELLLALSTKNMHLLAHVFDAYKSAPLAVQVGIRQLVTPLVKSVAAAPGRIIPELAQFPKGAETLALRIIFLLCSEGARVPGRELVEAVLRMCDERGLDGNFVVFIMNGLERAEALARMPLLVSILNGADGPRALVREGFMRLITPFLGRPGVLSPTDLLLALHGGVTRDNIAKHVEAVEVYEAMARPDGKPMFTGMLFDTALKLLVDQDPVSPLITQTADIYHRRRGGPAGTVIGLLRRLIEREVWNMDAHVFDAFVESFRVMLPGTFALVKLLPTEPLQAVVDRSPPLRTAIREYVGKMPEPARRPYQWLLDSPPEPEPALPSA